MEHKVFTFKIKEIIERNLDLNNLETIHVTKKYELYMKQRLLFLNYWQEICPYWRSELSYFVSIDEARQRAEDVVENYIENRKKDMALEKFRKELKTTVRIVSEFNISAD